MNFLTLSEVVPEFRNIKWCLDTPYETSALYYSPNNIKRRRSLSDEMYTKMYIDRISLAVNTKYTDYQPITEDVDLEEIVEPDEINDTFNMSSSNDTTIIKEPTIINSIPDGYIPVPQFILNSGVNIPYGSSISVIYNKYNAICHTMEYCRSVGDMLEFITKSINGKVLEEYYPFVLEYISKKDATYCDYIKMLMYNNELCIKHLLLYKKYFNGLRRINNIYFVMLSYEL